MKCCLLILRTDSTVYEAIVAVTFTEREVISDIMGDGTIGVDISQFLY
jgi:hypothetical protein